MSDESKSAHTPDRQAACRRHERRHLARQQACRQASRCAPTTCHVQGNALDLWALAHRLPLYEAALDLAATFHLQTQRIREEATRNLELAKH